MLKIQQRLATAIARRLLLLLAAGLTVCNLQAQDDAPTVRFSKPVATLREALTEIETQTGYKLSVNHTNFDVTRRVNLPQTAIGLEEALKHILYGTGRTYMLRGRHILIIPQAGVPAIVPAAEPEAEPPGGEPETEIQPREPLHPVVIKPGEDIVSKGPSRQNRTFGARFTSHRETARRTNEGINPVRRLPGVGIKANLLYGGAALTPNLGVEFGVTPRSTVDIRGGYNQWGLEGSWEENKKLANWQVSAEYRYWFCERFAGHFVGVHGFFGYYNISQHNLPLLFGKDSDLYRYQGNIFGAGISYGYQWVLGKRWNLEAQIGAGFGLMKYDRFDCPRCGDPLERDEKRTYFGPTRAGISLIYLIK